MTNGYIAALVATVVGVVTVTVASLFVPREVDPMLREPLVQGVGAIAAWLSAWPWFRHNLTRPHVRAFFAARPRHPINVVKPFGFIGYALWMIVGLAVITAARVYFKTG